MSKDFKAHAPAPAKPSGLAPSPPPAPPRRIDKAELETAAKAKAEAENKPGERPAKEKPKEIGGPEGPEPTRYGDWERKGICVDF